MKQELNLTLQRSNAIGWSAFFLQFFLLPPFLLRKAQTNHHITLVQHHIRLRRIVLMVLELVIIIANSPVRKAIAGP